MPAITDPADAAAEPELAVLSAVAHGNGPNGRAVIEAALAGLGALDPHHETVYSWVIWKGLRKRMRPALEALIMNLREQMEKDPEFNAFVRRVFAPWKQREAAEAAAKEGKLLGLRDALLRLTARAGIALTDEDLARVDACEDAATLERWVENVLGAKTTADVFGA